MTDSLLPFRTTAGVLALCLLAGSVAAQNRTDVPRAAAPRSGDYIVALVNQELVTAGELQQRIDRVRQDAARSRTALPPEAELRRQLLDVLIDERVQLSYARENGSRVDDTELDRAVANVALQNQLSMPQLRERLRAEGMDFTRFRNNIRDQILTERVREREMQGRIRISDADIDAYIEQRRVAAGAGAEYNLAQILVSVPEGAEVAVVAQRRAQAEAALARVRGGEAFDVVAREVSEDANRAKGGEIGMRAASRLPDAFVEVARPLKVGEVAPTLLRTGAGFHVMKLLAKTEASAFSVAQTRARHILLRVSPQLPQDAAVRRLAEFKRQVLAGSRSFEQLARENSEDGSAAQGGDLGWTSAGAFVPEFETAMNALPLNGISDPVVSRFGVHLIQVVERRQTTLDAKQQRDQARAALRELKFDDAYAEWIRDLRARAYVELREPPL